MTIDIAPFAESYPILLVVDANVLVAELLRRRGRRLIADPRLELTITEQAWSETVHEMERRYRERLRHDPSIAGTAAAARDEAIAFAEGLVERVPDTFYRDVIPEAARRIPDPHDVHTGALAIATNAAIWTADEHFWGGGLRVWRTERLLEYLGV